MNPMSRLPLTAAAILLVALGIGLIGKTLDLDGAYYPIAFFIGMFIVSLTDRDRFYARDLRHNGHGRS